MTFQIVEKVVLAVAIFVLATGWVPLSEDGSTLSFSAFPIRADNLRDEGVESNAYVLLTDPLGRKDGETRSITPEQLQVTFPKEFEEIPEADCGVMEVDDHSGEGGFLQYMGCGVDHPVEGEWTAIVTGIAEGVYYADLTTEAASHKLSVLVDCTRRISLTRPGRRQEWRFTYSKREDAVVKLIRVATFNDGIEDLDIARRINWIDNDGILNSLKQKWNNAQKDADKGNKGAAINVLGAFKNEVNAHKGKHLKAEAAQILLEDADYLIGQIGGTSSAPPPSPPGQGNPPSTPPGQDKKKSPRR